METLNITACDVAILIRVTDPSLDYDTVPTGKLVGGALSLGVSYSRVELQGCRSAFCVLKSQAVGSLIVFIDLFAGF